MADKFDITFPRSYLCRMNLALIADAYSVEADGEVRLYLLDLRDYIRSRIDSRDKALGHAAQNVKIKLSREDYKMISLMCKRIGETYDASRYYLKIHEFIEEAIA